MSSASTKDVTKAINAFLPHAALPLPDELKQVIDTFLEKHIEEGIPASLQDDLLSIWDKSVKENVSLSLAKEAWANTLAILAHDGDGQTDQEEGANQIATRLLEIWMQNSHFAGQEGGSSGLIKAKLVHEGLLNYGKKRPKLFNVYARLLFWDRERSLAADNPEKDVEDEKTSSDWEKCEYSPDIDNMSIPNLLSYFTILYGLYPLNFVDYIRKPQRYLRHANMPNPDDIEVQPSEIRQKSERFRQYHVLHPNFYNLTSESEKTDFSRWLKSEASEVVAECTALCFATELGAGNEVGHSHELGLSEDDNAKNGGDQSLHTSQALLERSPSHDLAGSWRNSAPGSLDEARSQAAALRRTSQASHTPSLREAFQNQPRDGPGDSPTLPPSLVLSASHTNLRDMILSNKVIKSGLHQSLPNDSVPSLALSHQESIPEKIASRQFASVAPPSVPTTPAEHSNELIRRLYKKILLLSNDLSFERYMKQQHMIHIGELKRRQLREAATEAETQNLIMVNKNLRNRISEAKQSELRAKKESENRRNIAKKWETDLSAKLKVLREEQKKWNSEGAALKRELEAKMEECEKLTKMVCEYETTELNSKQNLQAINDHIEEIARLKAEVSRLIEVERTYQSKEKETEARLAEAAESISKAEGLSMKLDARDAEVEEVRRLYESQITELNSRLHDVLENGTSKPKRDNDAPKVVESTLAASRAKMAELQKQHNLLVRKYTVLQSSLLDMSASTRSPLLPATPRMGGISDSSDAELSAIVRGGDPPSPIRKRSSRGRGFSDPELFSDGTRFNVTAPVDSTTSGSSSNTVLHHPSPPTGVSSASSNAEKTPAETTRYYGRGGTQNSGRKDKKDKKPSGIRSIRGFG
ncbi:hypothetical protein VSDG_02472 [Cytospora chrysosperma]|uniref:Tuberous sclerosis 1 n=1 Tax=Cytospora chrysosperma TaxID=252740 RepID=A0A423WG89_CYTCH|nr:hypothetical protein VSDG_02472 [Valsa sordida]